MSIVVPETPTNGVEAAARTPSSRSSDVPAPYPHYRHDGSGGDGSDGEQFQWTQRFLSLRDVILVIGVVLTTTATGVGVYLVLTTRMTTLEIKQGSHDDRIVDLQSGRARNADTIVALDRRMAVLESQQNSLIPLVSDRVDSLSRRLEADEVALRETRNVLLSLEERVSVLTKPRAGRP